MAKRRTSKELIRLAHSPFSSLLHYGFTCEEEKILSNIMDLYMTASEKLKEKNEELERTNHHLRNAYAEIFRLQGVIEERRVHDTEEETDEEVEEEEEDPGLSLGDDTGHAMI